MSGKKYGVVAAAVWATLGYASIVAHGQVISYTTVGGNYTQDFDSLGTATGSAVGTYTWADGATLNGWYAFKTLPNPGGPPTDYRAANGSSNSGQIYAFGTGDSTDRALGSVGSGTPSTMYYGMQMVNNTGVTLGGFTLSYTGEEWRATGSTSSSTTVVNTLQFAYSTTATSVGATSGYNAATSLDFRAPDAGSPPGYAIADGPVNGNDPTFQRAISGNVTIIGGWAPGASLWLRWTDINDPGNDQGLGIDNLTFSAIQHIPQHNGTSLNVGGSKTPAQVDLGRVVLGQATNSVNVNLSNTGAVSTGYQDISTDGSQVTPATGTVPSNGSTPIAVRVGQAGTAVGDGGIGSDIIHQAVVQNTGEDNDGTVTIETKAHVVANRFIDNYQDEDLGGGPGTPINMGKMLVGSTKTVPVKFTTTNTNTGDYSSNALTTVTLLAGTAPEDGPVGSSTLSGAYGKGTLSTGTADVTFDDGGDAESRSLTFTPLMSGLVKPQNAAGERSPGFLSVPLRQDDTAAGASGDARLYIQGDFYSPAGVTGTMTGSDVVLTNTSAGNGTPGKRLGADILGTSVDQTGWTVNGISGSIGASTATPSSTPSITGTATLSPAGKLNGTYGATLSVQLQNDQTQGVYGVAPHDLPDSQVTLTGTVSDKPQNQNGSYTLNAGTLDAPATTLSGSFNQSGGTATIASLVGGGAVTVSGGSLTIGAGSTSAADVVGNLTTSGSGKVVLADSHLVMANNPRTMLATGYNGGNWGGNGLVGAAAQANSAGIVGVAYGTATDVLGGAGTWFGANVGAGSYLVSAAFYGDINMNGKVDLDDYALLDKGFNKHLSAGTAVWHDGDFNYDGSVTMADYTLADRAYILSNGTTLSAELLAERVDQFGGEYVSSLLASVPEPASLGLIGTAAFGLLGRRRRQAR